MTTYAHSANRHRQRHELAAHLRGVAELARAFAAPFGAEQAAFYLGLWHDLGKYNPAFQNYLLASERDPTLRGTGPDHKAAGAHIAAVHLEALALLVQGHHGGLRSRDALKSWLLQHPKDDPVRTALALAHQEIPDLEPKDLILVPSFVAQPESWRTLEFFLRMLFSALVDADFLDTERHFDAQQRQLRGGVVTMGELWRRFELAQRSLLAKPDTPVNRARAAMYQNCLAAADAPPGIFRLTVPTGGGKTRSGMGFALRHALEHGMQRIIIAVPYITITEQTAAVYRSIFETAGEDRQVVLEHHSNVEASDDEEGVGSRQETWRRLAAENWDAPIVVTTTVQLFESIFGRSTSRTRKLHQLAKAVIVIDEAQSLPARLLTPILDSLRELTQHYGATVVLSTATQPAFETIPVFAAVPAREIVADPPTWFRVLKRVEYDWRIDRPLTWPELGQLLRSQGQVLAIFNTKGNALSAMDALKLPDGLEDPSVLHLSRLLCGAHRKHVLNAVRQRMEDGRPCRLIATQVVEAGVDLDFPLVVRALGPLDSVIQAAGRCNREGLLPTGKVVVVRLEGGGTPPGDYRLATDETVRFIATAPPDLHDPVTMTRYFDRYFNTRGPRGTDRSEVQLRRDELDYPEVERRFRMIEEETESVVVPYGNEEERGRVQELVSALRQSDGNPRLTMRLLQPYLVSLRRREAEQHRTAGRIAPIFEGLGEWLAGYDPVRGLTDSFDLESLLI